MKITRKRELIIERERRVRIKFNEAPPEAQCSKCDALAHFVTVDEAAIIKQTPAREIYRMVENGSIHFLENERGGLLVCLTSLSK